MYAQEDSNEEFTLEEITVTAQKREENVQKTSLSISVLTGDQIQEKSYTAVTDMLQNVAGVQLQGAGTSSQIFIRGIGLNNLDTAYGDPAIALNVDGIQQQRGGSDRTINYGCRACRGASRSPGDYVWPERHRRRGQYYHGPA